MRFDPGLPSRRSVDMETHHRLRHARLARVDARGEPRPARYARETRPNATSRGAADHRAPPPRPAGGGSARRYPSRGLLDALAAFAATPFELPGPHPLHRGTPGR